MLESADAIVGLAQTRRDPLAGQLRVALLPTIGPYLLPLVALEDAQGAAAPGTDAVRVSDRADARATAQRRASTSASWRCRCTPKDSQTRELYEEPFVAALPAGTRSAARTRIRVEDLKGETLLLLEDGHCLRDQALAVCSRSGVQEKQDFRATSIETLRQMVAVGAGVTLLPALASRGAYGAAKGLAVRPFAKPVPSRRIGAVWRKSSARTAAIEAVCDQIVRHSGLDAPPRPMSPARNLGLRPHVLAGRRSSSARSRAGLISASCGLSRAPREYSAAERAGAQAAAPRRASRGTRRAARPKVYLLPGMLGSQLGWLRDAGEPPDLLWLDPGRYRQWPAGRAAIAVARVRPPRAQPRRCSRSAPLSTAICALKLRLAAAGFEVVLYDYDWRGDLLALGRTLAGARLEADAAEQMALVGHSMGGLLARAALAHYGGAAGAERVTG